MNQEGGYDDIDGQNYLILSEGDKLIEPDKTYLFVTRVSGNGWHTFAPAYGDLLIADQTDRQYKTERFERAFAQEIPIKGAAQGQT